MLVGAHDDPDGTLTPAAQSGPVAVAVSQRSGYDGVLELAFDAADRRHTSLVAVHATFPAEPGVSAETVREGALLDPDEVFAHPQVCGKVLEQFRERRPPVRTPLKQIAGHFASSSLG
ncbi:MULTISPECIES: hypothetical protein [unclassified Kitasatospora]|uniref:hypothetical protein n=1 Tax=unclassified Kitasatospora TaxID=2633591 RepID=UPI0033CCFAFB